MLMAPLQRRDWPPGFPPEQARHAAGLLLLFPVADRPHIVATLRADTLGRHGGQVSLPGGVVEPGESVEQAALRESHEEVGLGADAVRSLARLTPVDIPVSGFRLYPVIGVVDERPVLTPADGEVARILEIPVEMLFPGTIAWRSIKRDGRTLDFPAFLVDSAEIWGATAMILAEFLVLLGWTGPAIADPRRP